MFEDCRDRGHPWMLPSEARRLGMEDVPERNWVMSNVDALRTQVCFRCTTRKFEVFGLNGVRLSHPRYRYVPGYLNRGGKKRSRTDYRTVAVKAALKAMKGRKQNR
jgi:hypothetical protein